MKKIFFSAMVAIVAVGGAFAGNTAKRITDTYGTNQTSPCPKDQPEIPCSQSGPGPVCTNSSSQALYTTNALTGLCSVQLFNDF